VTWPLFSWLSLVDGDIATREVLARKAFNCRLSFSSIVQRYKAEAPRTSGALLRDDRRVNDCPERSEQCLKFCFRCIKGKISHKKFHKKDDLRECQLPKPFPRIGFQITNEELLTDDLPCYEQKNKRLNHAHPVPGKNQVKVLSMHPGVAVAPETKTNVNEAYAHFSASQLSWFAQGKYYLQICWDMLPGVGLGCFAAGTWKNLV
jgi:hypothetical protein